MQSLMRTPSRRGRRRPGHRRVPAPATRRRAADAAYKVLVFSKTAGFRHDAIPDGIPAIQHLGTANNFTVTATEDAAAFTTANLAQYEAVVFLSTTGDVLNATQQTAFESYIRAAAAIVGVHAAADTEYDWPCYGNLVGAWFASHPAIQQATVRVEDRATPRPRTCRRPGPAPTSGTTTGPTPAPPPTCWPPRRVVVHRRTMGADHPITWCKTYRGGRSWYTGLGHTEQSYTEPTFRAHLLGGIR